MELIANRGKGYRPADKNKNEADAKRQFEKRVNEAKQKAIAENKKIAKNNNY